MIIWGTTKYFLLLQLYILLQRLFCLLTLLNFKPMKRLLLFAMGAMVSMASFAQEEDVTHYIQNAGFDEDLTFQVDGTMKEAISTNTSLSGRSWAYIAADSTV